MYREEHPNPQFCRSEWKNLNGEWDFEFDFGVSGRERRLYESNKFSRKIMVPFCPESKLSGIEYRDFMNCVWYRRSFDISQDWKTSGRIFIRFGAVDYKATVYVNQKEVGTHIGGYTSFGFDITDYVTDGANAVCVCAEDDNRRGLQPRGKQADRYASSGCDYTRTTGIWQTVWLEHTPDSYIENFRFYPDIRNGRLLFDVTVHGSERLDITVSYNGKPVGNAELVSDASVIRGEIALSERHLWEPGCGRLYDVELQYGGDRIKSYFGLREIKMDGYRFLLNGRSVFQRLVLDQGFYQDGIYTAPSEADLVRDIQLSVNAGFNGARLHQKVFEPRFLYHCDRMGYMVWGEFPNWGLDVSCPQTLPSYISQWREAVERDFNHPSVIGWCPFNETWDYQGRRQWDELISTIYHMTKAMDHTRPCIDTSGLYHVVTDIFDVHDYEQDPEIFRDRFKNLGEGKIDNFANDRQAYKGEPVFVSEYGGISRAADNEKGWGYGTSPESDEEFLRRYEGLTTALLDNPCIFGFCYTQLYDIEQEVNGLYTYAREPKFDMNRIKAVNMRKAAIEEN